MHFSTHIRIYEMMSAHISDHTRGFGTAGRDKRVINLHWGVLNHVCEAGLGKPYKHINFDVIARNFSR